jgi:hypothetical protein
MIYRTRGENSNHCNTDVDHKIVLRVPLITLMAVMDISLFSLFALSSQMFSSEHTSLYD